MIDKKAKNHIRSSNKTLLTNNLTNNFTSLWNNLPSHMTNEQQINFLKTMYTNTYSNLIDYDYIRKRRLYIR